MPSHSHEYWPKRDKKKLTETGPSLSAYNDVQSLFDAPPPPPPSASSSLPLLPTTTTSSTSTNSPAILNTINAFASVEAMLVVDSGYSHTTVTPLLRGRPAQAAIRRLDVGGKLLTNYLKELASVRHYNMMDETYLMNEAKEAVCFVSRDLRRDLERTWRGGGLRYSTSSSASASASRAQQQRRKGIVAEYGDDGGGDGRDRRRARGGAGGGGKGEEEAEQDSSILVDFVLPDYVTRMHGFVRPHVPLGGSAAAARMRMLGGGPGGGGVVGVGDGGGGVSSDAATAMVGAAEVMTLGNERFTVPEVLFSPADTIGLNQAGLAETVMQSLHALPGALWPALLANVVLVGGNANIPGLLERLWVFSSSNPFPSLLTLFLSFLPPPPLSLSPSFTRTSVHNYYQKKIFLK